MSKVERSDPQLRERVQRDITRSDKGGKRDQWSARKAQLAVQEYKRRGGGYRGRKPKDTSLEQWTEEEWGTKSGRKSLESGERYLPKRAREELSDVVEICFFAMDRVVRSWPEGTRKDRGITQDPEDAINELNTRFRRDGFGYQFEAGQIMRVDSQYLHSEVVKPALVLLADPCFPGAREELLSAHAHYRAGEHEQAIVDANKAFESTMKAVCKIKGLDV